jgi:hypothetical protein
MDRMRIKAVLVLGLLLSSSCVVAQNADFAGAHDQYTPVVMQGTVQPVPFLGTDGKTHLDYELQLINTTADPVTIVAVEVLDDQGASLLKLGSDDLKKWFTLADKTATAKLGPAQVGYVWLDVQTGGAAPRALKHRVTVTAKEKGLRNSAMAASPTEETFPLDGGEVMVSKQARLVLGPPLEGKGWVAMSACCGNMGHRRAGIPINGGYFVGQRFAIDWIKLGDDARIVRQGGKVDVNTDYPTYGTHAIAVADATVVSVLDGLPERTAGTLPQDTTLQNVTGNHVILDLGGGRYGFYAHLQPGSLKVKKGDRVKKGQVLALVGNSGNTTGPHLHFHVMEGLSVLGAQGVPYVIDSFTLAGEIRDIPDDEGANAFMEPLAITPQPPPQRRMEYPMENTVVDFPGGK